MSEPPKKKDTWFSTYIIAPLLVGILLALFSNSLPRTQDLVTIEPSIALPKVAVVSTEVKEVPVARETEPNPFLGSWKGVWRGSSIKKFELRISKQGDKLVARGKAEGWRFEELFEVEVSGQSARLVGKSVEPKPLPGQKYWLDVLNVNLHAEDGKIEGSWNDSAGDHGTIEVTRTDKLTLIKLGGSVFVGGARSVMPHIGRRGLPVPRTGCAFGEGDYCVVRPWFSARMSIILIS